MDLTAGLGIVLALLAIVGGNYLEGGQVQELLNLPAAAIVFCGTFAAALIQSPFKDIKRAFNQISWVFNSNCPDMEAGINRVVHWCVVARRKGLLALEPEAEKEKDSFIHSGLMLLVDGRDSNIIHSSLEIEMITAEQRDLQGAKVIESMGGYAPTLGIIGAVLGLIHVLSRLTDPESLGVGIATAFVATIYGIGAANLLFIPIANKIKNLVLIRYQYQEMIMEGLMYIAEGQNPKAIKQRLQGYLR